MIDPPLTHARLGSWDNGSIVARYLYTGRNKWLPNLIIFIYKFQYLPENYKLFKATIKQALLRETSFIPYTFILQYIWRFSIIFLRVYP